MEARNQAFTEGTVEQAELQRKLGLYHSLELPDGTVLPGLISLEQLKWRLNQFPIPSNLNGKRVLDVGTWDGWFAFEMERRGAEVVAIDSNPKGNFLTNRDLMQSKVEFVSADICRVTPAQMGYFDIVLFFGVLYHLKHPLLGIENVCRLTREMACIVSYVTDGGSCASTPAMEFYETTELRGQFDNWCGPNTQCLLAWCRAAGFPRVE